MSNRFLPGQEENISQRKTKADVYPFYITFSHCEINFISMFYWAFCIFHLTVSGLRLMRNVGREDDK